MAIVFQVGRWQRQLNRAQTARGAVPGMSQDEVQRLREQYRAKLQERLIAYQLMAERCTALVEEMQARGYF